MTKEEAITKDFIAALKTIKPANAYEAGKYYTNDFSNCVYDWDDKPVPDEATKQIIVEDALIEHEEVEEVSEAHYRSIEFTVKIYLPGGANTVSGLRKAEIDIIHCIGANETAFLNKYGDVFRLVKREKILSKKNKTLGASRIIVKFHLSTNRWMIGEPEYN